MAFSDEVLGGLSPSDLTRPVAAEDSPQDQLRKYLATLPLEQRRQYIAAQRGQSAPARQSTPASQPQGMMPMYDHGMNMAYGGFNAAMMGAQEGNNNLQGMAGDVMSVFQNENESRVAQERERRRMEYQKWLAEQQLYLQWGKMDNERARQQADNAMEIRKLKAAMEMRNPSKIRRRSFKVDPLTGERRWMEDWE